MAAYTVQNAIDFVRPFVKNIPVSAIQVTAADIINSIIWCAYPWRWSLAALTAIPLSDGVQDFGSAPTNYFRIVRARITRTDTTPDQYNELVILRTLTPELTKAGFSTLSSISYEGAIDKFRLNFAASVPTGITLQIDGEFQTVVTKITAASATFAFPDQYFRIFCEGLAWFFHRLADDSRQGQCSANKQGQVIYTGQMGIFYDALITMRESEEWGAGDTIFPTDPLGSYRNANPTIFGP